MAETKAKLTQADVLHELVDRVFRGHGDAAEAFAAAAHAAIGTQKEPEEVAAAVNAATGTTDEGGQAA